MIKKEFSSVDVSCVLQHDDEIGQRPISGYLTCTPMGTLKFEQTLVEEKNYTRNPHLFKGEFINIGRNKEGEIILNFRRFKDIGRVNVADFAIGVYSEINRELPLVL